eukprot:5343644-Pleurochrysis_carterae.AAC.2
MRNLTMPNDTCEGEAVSDEMWPCAGCREQGGSMACRASVGVGADAAPRNSRSRTLPSTPFSIDAAMADHRR